MTRNVLSRNYGRGVWFTLNLRKPETQQQAQSVGPLGRIVRALKRLREDETVTKLPDATA